VSIQEWVNRKLMQSIQITEQNLMKEARDEANRLQMFGPKVYEVEFQIRGKPGLFKLPSRARAEGDVE
jgi:hypothetical protein